MKKIENLIVCIPCIIFIVWYFIISYANIYACDDYWYGANVHTFGFWKTQNYYWYNWEGSFTHTFFATIPHLFHASKMPFICNMLSLFFFLSSTIFFIKTFFQIPKISAFFCSCYIIAFLLTFTSGGAEIRYWVCANNTYLLGISTILIFISLYHNYDHKKIIWLLLLLIIIIGNKVSYIYFTFVCTLLHDAIYTRLTIKRFTIILLVFSVLSLLNILAPGNFVRLSQNMKESAEYGITLIETFGYRMQDIGTFGITTVLLLPICIILHPIIKRKSIVLLTIGFLLVFIGDTIIMYICFHDSGPKRENILIETMAILYTYSLMAFFMSKLKIENLKIPLLLISSLMFSYLSSKNIFQINPSYTYSKLAKERERMVLAIQDEKEITLPPLPDSGLLLSYFSNEEIWIENVYLSYYGKKLKVIIASQNDN